MMPLLEYFEARLWARFFVNLPFLPRLSLNLNGLYDSNSGGEVAMVESGTFLALAGAVDRGRR